ncbi:MAG: GNAT family N-acetyltransferase [Actinobacteria bacterium]|nr:GNAT family N-acetyltransferase [Actinomycetota bacterium]
MTDVDMRADDAHKPGSAVLRELREEDAEEVASLFRLVFGDERPIDALQVASWVRNEELKPEWLRVLELGGDIVGYGDIWINGDEVALDVVAPGHWATFFDWAEERARAQRLRRVRVLLPAGHETEPVVEQRGYRLWRSNYTMQVALQDTPPEPRPLPAGLEVRPYRPSDEDPLRAALNECFANDPFFHEASQGNFREFYLRARAFDPSLWLLAADGQELAGFLLAFPERAGEHELGWIESLGVRPPWRRRGLGEALLRAALGELHARGLRRVGLGVDAENETGALRLYERVGMRVVRQGNNWTLDL